MKFYNREKECEILQELEAYSANDSLRSKTQ